MTSSQWIPTRDPKSPTRNLHTPTSDDPRDLDVRISKAAQAERDLNNSPFGKALETIRQRQLDAFECSEPADKEARESAYAILRACKELRQQLTIVVRDGKVAGNRRETQRFQEKVGTDGRAWGS